MSTGHKPEDHALIPIVETRSRRAGRANRQERPPNHYQCSCGAILPGESRRQAKAAHKTHRDPLARK